MRRLGYGLTAVIMVIVSGFTPVYASPNDFTISQFSADYYLGTDAEGRSTLRTVERITAEFPTFDQNHGIERALPMRYNGHSTSLKVQSVTDGTNKGLNFTTSEANDSDVLRIGDIDQYVHGSKTYIITYTEHDVTKYFADMGRDEFYWDTNGTDWQQTFGVVTARVHLTDSIKLKLTKDVACYRGLESSTDRCDISGDGTTITAATRNLKPNENMTIAVGFNTGTFQSYQPSNFEKIVMYLMILWITINAVTTAAAIVLIVWLLIHYNRQSNRRKDIGTVVAEYIPPKNMSVLAAAQIGEGTKAEMTAQLIDLAVRHYVKIYQTQEKSLWMPAEYELEIVKSINDLSNEEKQLLATLFGGNGTKLGARFSMKTLKNNYAIAAQLQADAKVLIKHIKGTYDLRHKDEVASVWFKRVGWWGLGISVVTLSPVLFIASIVSFVCASQLYPLTAKGVDLRRYLMGLKLYISVAEEDRLKMLQSPEGAEKVGRKIAGSSVQLVKLYERALPYAVLFGQEKEWNQQLGAYYDKNGTQPDWYSSNVAFNAVVFTSAMDGFGTTMNSYSASTSSSSGGSGGGGFSGGGGGGGGGGGW